MRYFKGINKPTEIEIAAFKKDVLADNSILQEVNINKLSYLQLAVMFGDFYLSKFLIDNGINVNNKDDKGSTALHYCPDYEQYEIAEYILNNGGRLDIEDNYGNQPLWVAAINARVEPEKLEIVKLFLEFGGDKYHINKNNKTPNDFALRYDILKNLFNSFPQK